MKAAKIVYIMIGIFLFLPWLVYNVKTYISYKNDMKKYPAGRIISFILVTVVMIAAVYGHCLPSAISRLWRPKGPEWYLPGG